MWVLSLIPFKNQVHLSWGTGMWSLAPEIAGKLLLFLLCFDSCNWLPYQKSDNARTPTDPLTHKQAKTADRKRERDRQLAWALRFFVLFCLVASVLSLVYSHTHKDSDFHSPLTIWVFALVWNLPYRALLSSAHAWPQAANYNCHYMYSSFCNRLLLV